MAALFPADAPPRRAPVFLRRNLRTVQRAAAADAATEWTRRIDLDIATHLEEMNEPEHAADLGATLVQRFMRNEIHLSNLEVRIEPIVGSDGCLATFRIRVSCHPFTWRRTLSLDAVGLTLDDVLSYMAADHCLKYWRLVHGTTALPDRVRRLRDVQHMQHDALLARLAAAT